MRRIFYIALRLFLLMTVITGLLYPLAVTGLANLLFPGASQGSLVSRQGVVMGSSLLGQGLSDPAYFWSRPSACDYGTLPSGASNLGPTSKELRALMAKRAGQWIAGNGSPVPPEMVAASGSGLDPHISPEAAIAQLPRIARARRWKPEQVEAARTALYKFTEQPLLGFIGQPRVNTFLLNLTLDGI
jgi:potassium-transporting ATPase KdpC subunit